MQATSLRLRADGKIEFSDANLRESAAAHERAYGGCDPTVTCAPGAFTTRCAPPRHSPEPRGRATTSAIIARNRRMALQARTRATRSRPRAAGRRARGLVAPAAALEWDWFDPTWYPRSCTRRRARAVPEDDSRSKGASAKSRQQEGAACAEQRSGMSTRATRRASPAGAEFFTARKVRRWVDPWGAEMVRHYRQAAAMQLRHAGKNHDLDRANRVLIASRNGV